ncbi:MAG: hypothetical protein CMP66_02825 [Flavobacteriales bacterium]|nr:hypothetical protein [Flavobacteriales bacterium]
MIQVDDKIISFEVFEKQFVCDLSACKGACCVEGDAGAPLADKELDILPNIYNEVKSYMRTEGIAEIEKQGFFVLDGDGDKTTPLVKNKECAFVVFDENNIAKCSIEQAYNDGKINFKKPISCHLFPIRIKEYRDFDAVNYEAINICKPACFCGESLRVPVYRFLKEPLIRLYGEEWYDKLTEAARLLKNQCKK